MLKILLWIYILEDNTPPGIQQQISLQRLCHPGDLGAFPVHTNCWKVRNETPDYLNTLVSFLCVNSLYFSTSRHLFNPDLTLSPWAIFPTHNLYWNWYQTIPIYAHNLPSNLPWIRPQNLTVFKNLKNKTFIADFFF